MKAKRWISLLLAVSMMLGVLAMPASAAAQQPESTAVVSEELSDAAALSAAEDENDIVNIRIRATGNLVYGSDYKLEVETRPENTQYIAVVLGTSGEAYGYVTLMISDKLRTLLKLIPLPKKMSQTPDQAEEFNVYSYLKQLIDGNDVGVLLRVADEVVSVMDTVSFFVPASYLTTVKNVSNGMKLTLSLIRKYLPEGALSRIYLDEQPKDSGKYVAGAIALESSDINAAGFAMFKIKPKTENVSLSWAADAPSSLTVSQLQNADLTAKVISDGQVAENGKVSYTYKKKSFLCFSSKINGVPTEPGTYTQTAKAGGNYSCSSISRTFTVTADPQPAASSRHDPQHKSAENYFRIGRSRKVCGFSGIVFYGRSYFLFSIKWAALLLQIDAPYAIIKIKEPLAVKKGTRRSGYLWKRKKAASKSSLKSSRHLPCAAMCWTWQWALSLAVPSPPSSPRWWRTSSTR